MNILFIVVGAVVIGGLSESFGGVVVGGIVGFLVAEMLKLRRELATLQRSVDDLAIKTPIAARDFGRVSDEDVKTPAVSVAESVNIPKVTPRHNASAACLPGYSA